MRQRHRQAELSSACTHPVLSQDARRAPQIFFHIISHLHRLLPRFIRHIIPVTFIGYALINGSAFFIDLSLLWTFYERLNWFYPLAVSTGYIVAGLYSLLLNRWLNFQAQGHLAAQGSRYLAGLASQYVIFILGLSSLLYWLGINAELARAISACCEGLYLYVLMRIWVFRGTPEPKDNDDPHLETANKNIINSVYPQLHIETDTTLNRLV